MTVARQAPEHALAASDCLSPLERAVARYFDEGLAYREIAAKVEKSENTVVRIVRMIDNRDDGVDNSRDRASSQDLVDRIRQFHPHVMLCGSGK